MWMAQPCAWHIEDAWSVAISFTAFSPGRWEPRIAEGMGREEATWVMSLV